MIEKAYMVPNWHVKLVNIELAPVVLFLASLYLIVGYIL